MFLFCSILHYSDPIDRFLLLADIPAHAYPPPSQSQSQSHAVGFNPQPFTITHPASPPPELLSYSSFSFP